MSYVVMARRWRPQLFNEIIGQDHVSQTLSNAIKNQRIAHAYIFTGPRGIGKTTTARILAKAVNCEKGPTPTPCNECPSCKAITLGNSLDVLEIDGASNRGIDEIRNLRENIRYTPSLGKYRIYIIDEVHMLTKEAFNALLKTLEEPPAHALFIFATTEIHKVPATILSRCQRFDFRRIPLKTIIGHLNHICEADQIEIEDEAMLQIAKKADGSMRDAQSILDQIISFSGNKVSYENVAQALGVIHQDLYFQISDLVREKDLRGLILLAKDVFDSGYDLNELLAGLEEHIRNILITATMNSTELIDVSENYLEKYQQNAQHFSENDLIAYLQMIHETGFAVKSSPQPHLKFEVGLIKMAKMPSALDLESVLEKLDVLKKKAPHSFVADSRRESYAASAPHSEDVGGNAISLDQIKHYWPDIIEYISKKQASLASVLESAELTDLEGSDVHIRFSSVNEFEKDMISKKLKSIEQIVSKIVKFKMRLRCDYNVLAAQKKNDNTGKKNVNKEEIMHALRGEDALNAKLIDEFDLELI